jgi:hypothetical protein
MSNPDYCGELWAYFKSAKTTPIIREGTPEQLRKAEILRDESVENALITTLNKPVFKQNYNEFKNLYNLVRPSVQMSPPSVQTQKKPWYSFFGGQPNNSQIPDEPSNEFRQQFDNINNVNKNQFAREFMTEFGRLSNRAIQTIMKESDVRNGGKRRRKTRGKSRRSKTRKRRRS